MDAETSRAVGDELIAELASIKAPRRPLTWFLDVDGVVNAYSKAHAEGADPWHYRTFTQSSDSVRYRINFAPDLMRVINAMAEGGYVEIMWLTTWQDQANGRLMVKLGLNGPYPVLTNPTKAEGYARSLGQADVDSDYAWWKLIRVSEQLGTDPTMKAIWTDDDLPYERAAQHFLTQHDGRVLSLAPEPYYGLTPTEMRTMMKWISEQDQ